MNLHVKKLCINCHHYGVSQQQVKNQSEHECHHDDMLSPVTGAPGCCERARAPGGRCAPEGRLFSAREVGALETWAASTLFPVCGVPETRSPSAELRP